MGDDGRGIDSKAKIVFIGFILDVIKNSFLFRQSVDFFYRFCGKVVVYRIAVNANKN